MVVGDFFETNGQERLLIEEQVLNVQKNYTEL